MHYQNDLIYTIILLFPTARYPPPGEKSRAVTFLIGVLSVGQLAKTVQEGRWTNFN
jgi:hypothetical protein